MIREDLLDGLPCKDMIQEGFVDLAAGRETISSLLVSVGYPRLRSLGFERELSGPMPVEPEKKLYWLLAQRHGPEAHSQYNALIRRLVSFERALEHRKSRVERLKPPLGT